MIRSKPLAQTNVQLFNQLRFEHYSENEIVLIWKVYEFGMLLFAGLYLPSGRPFIDHLVRTASILVWLGKPVDIVAAGLIHAAYHHGDFGSAKEGVTQGKRERLKAVVGERIEQYLEAYERFEWNPKTLQALHENHPEISSLERDVVLIRLCNELEHCLDLGALYFSGSLTQQAGHQRFIGKDRTLITSLAAKLGWESLAVELEKAYRQVANAELPIEPRIRTDHKIAYLVESKSYSEHLSIQLHRMAAVCSKEGKKCLSKIQVRLRKLIA